MQVYPKRSGNAPVNFEIVYQFYTITKYLYKDLKFLNIH